MSHAYGPQILRGPQDRHRLAAEVPQNNTRLLEQIKPRRHERTVTTVSQAVSERRRSHKTRNIAVGLQDWLVCFYMSCIPGIRFLIGQHVVLNTLQPDKDYVGRTLDPRYVCEEHYAIVTGRPVELSRPKEPRFAYVPEHLQMLKNSSHAVVECSGANPGDEFPPIKVIVVKDREDITIKISDEGGGIPRSAIPLIWTYMYTTMENQGLDADFDATDFQAPMAGFGYSLPLSRQYFGGGLKLINMEGYGTDVYIHLNRLSSSRKPLP